MVLESILSPQFLVRNINVISLIIAGFILVIFDEFATRIAFRITDNLRNSTESGIKEFGKKRNSKVIQGGATFLSKSIATTIILIYCYFGTTILAYYIFAPILTSLREFLLIVIIMIFLVISYIVNEKRVRERLMRA
ncbi:MAG: hypothetical protein Q8L29_00680 [archaeon]|nr:hypothetical protein [archaeon]